MNTSDLTCASVTISDGLADVVLAATGKANRMGPDYWAQMPALFARLDEDEAVRVVLLRGAGEHFTFGLDLAAMSAELAPVLSPDGGAKARQQLLGIIRKMQDANTCVARELAFTGDDFDAARALRIGLVNEVYDTQAALLDAARAMAVRIAKNSPLVTRGIKEVMNASSEVQAAHSLATVALWNSAFLPSKDLLEAMAAFLEKREATFTGE